MRHSGPSSRKILFGYLYSAFLPNGKLKMAYNIGFPFIYFILMTAALVKEIGLREKE